MAKERGAVLILLFAIVVIVVMTTMITMQVAEKAATKHTATTSGTVSFTILPSEQTTAPAAAKATGGVTFNIIK